MPAPDAAPHAAVVTRFAPSPTGYLHIGGARTALFNWVFARAQGGRFLLRIEDTDRARSTEDAVAAIYDGLAWLGLDWDDEPVRQAARAARHVEVADALMSAGAAYRCYVTPEELEARRAAGDAAREAYKTVDPANEAERATKKAELDAAMAAFRSPYRDGAPPPAPDAPFTVRLRIPDTAEITIEDAVQGPVSAPLRDLDDLVLVRADGTPTYTLAVVADDHDMGVTHIIRGDDHLTNALRQSVIYDALAWTRPTFAHVPLIHGPDGKKLSKRHGALGVEAYRDQGFVPAGLRNYLLRLGWGHGDMEVFTDAEARAVFSLDGISKAPARLDFDKLAHVNGAHLAMAPDADLAAALAPFLEKPPAQDLAPSIARVKDRAKTLADLADQLRFATQTRPLEFNAKAKKGLRGDAGARLTALKDRLQALDVWSEDAIKAALDAAAEEFGVGFGGVGAPLRAALTAGAPAPDIAFVAETLGQTETIGRIDDALAAV